MRSQQSGSLSSTTPSADTESSGGAPDPQEYRALVRAVSERVWQLWQQDLRREQERRGNRRR